jgi:2',3'-cyclic-nucleotide 2'-phosphodiesterase (5'-nucleotidase family)
VKQAFTRLLGLSFLAAVAGCASGRNAPPAAQGTAPAITLSIVGTNDVHGGILERDGRGGLALFAGYVRNLREARARDGGAVLLIDAGDMFQGTLESNLTEGAPVVAAYNLIGYAAAAVGNHEFDFGPVGPASTPAAKSDDPRGALKARAAEAKFPFLAANLIDKATRRPVAWPNVKPSTLIHVAGIPVGIIGVMTSEALTATTSANVVGLSVTPLSTTITAHARELRSKGAAIVIVTAHAGARCTVFTNPRDLASCDPAGEILAVLRALPRGAIDMVVAGHSHAGVAHYVEEVPVVEAFSAGRAFGRVDMVVDRTSHKVLDTHIFPPRDLCARENPATHTCDATALAEASAPAEYEGQPVVADPTIANVLAPALERVRALKSRPLGITLETPIRRQGFESALGNLFTDAVRASVPGADVSLHNTSGGLRADLPAGPLTYGSVYEVMPFDNKVVQLAVTGSQLKGIFARQFEQSKRILGVSGVRVRVRCSGVTLDVTLQRPSGAPIRDDEKLVLVTSDFLVTGGDDVLTPVIPPEGIRIPDTAPLSRDVLADYLAKHGGTLREDRLVDRSNPRIAVDGALPLNCRAAAPSRQLISSLP